MDSAKTPKKTTMMYVEFEMLDNMPIGCNEKDLYPHDGVFLLKRTDGSLSVVSVERGTGDGDCCYSFVETFIGSKPTIASENVMDARDVNKKLDEMSDKYNKDGEQREKELKIAYEMSREKLEHDYEMKKLKLEQEMPKRFEQDIRLVPMPFEPDKDTEYWKDKYCRLKERMQELINENED